MHNFKGLAAEIAALLKTSGDTGDSGDKSKKSSFINDVTVTTREAKVSPLTHQVVTCPRSSGDAKGAQVQCVRPPVTTVTSVTTPRRGGVSLNNSDVLPAEWHAILAELKRRDPVDWLSHDRWSDVLSDAENFLDRWGGAAGHLGWTALDLFGVHPTAPAVRFDVMGLALLIGGGLVVAITAETATIRRQSGAMLTYRRARGSAAVLISQAPT